MPSDREIQAAAVALRTVLRGALPDEREDAACDALEAAEAVRPTPLSREVWIRKATGILVRSRAADDEELGASILYDTLVAKPSPEALYEAVVDSRDEEEASRLAAAVRGREEAQEGPQLQCRWCDTMFGGRLTRFPVDEEVLVARLLDNHVREEHPWEYARDVLGRLFTALANYERALDGPTKG